jgi:hypothetical protein
MLFHANSAHLSCYLQPRDSLFFILFVNTTNIYTNITSTVAS